jgi:Starter unit:ACP transacylase in aflatoxin biosynthesis
MRSHAERDSELLNSSSSPVFIIGLCTGLLPAAAAAAARDTSDLLRIGAEIVAVAFRLGLEASRRSMQIEQVPGSWGVTVINVRPEEQQAIIDAFNRDTVMAPHSPRLMLQCS